MADRSVVVGHGPSLIGSGHGEYIDSFRYVLRLPCEGNWQTPEDFGHKTSYYCATMRKSKLIKGNHERFTWSKYQGRRGDSKERDVSMLIQSWQKRLSKTAYPFLSHGTAAICIAASELGFSIIALGCDALKDRLTNSKDYISSWVLEGRRQKKVHHSFDCEMDLIDKMAKEYGVSICLI